LPYDFSLSLSRRGQVRLMRKKSGRDKPFPYKKIFFNPPILLLKSKLQ
jgi:hypothetical protein